MPAGLDTIAWTLFGVGLVLLICGGWLLYLGVRHARRDTRPEGGGGNPVATQETDTPREPVNSPS